jgi:NADH dehydrogenase FAD-containing subunit
MSQIAVIATGSTYGSPMRLIADSMEAGKESLRALQQDIEAAQRIVCVGGGTVGIELAGEILERYPEKNVTIIQVRARPRPVGRLLIAVRET